jgi:hypothetical protein
MALSAAGAETEAGLTKKTSARLTAENDERPQLNINNSSKASSSWRQLS